MLNHMIVFRAAMTRVGELQKSEDDKAWLKLARHAAVCAALAIGALTMGSVAMSGHGPIGSQSAKAAENSDLYCRGYAEEAVRRYRDYTRKQCGDRINNVWHPSYYHHVAYCRGVSQSTAEFVKRERYRVLQSLCKPFFSPRSAQR